MPRPKKDGSRPVSRLVAEAQAEAHRSIVDEIETVITEAVDALPNRADYPEGPDRMSRLAGDIIGRHASLIATLRDLAVEHEDRARSWSKIASRVKPGRPAPIVADGLLWSGIQKAAKQPKKAGPSTLHTPGFYRTVYLTVEKRRLELRDVGKSATIKVALESLLEDGARKLSRRLSTFTEEHYGRYRAAYGRGRAMVLGA